MRFYRQADHEDLEKWFKARGMFPPTPKDLPDIGIVVPDVAAGFLVRTDTQAAVIDFLISNPATDKETRARAIDEIVTQLLLQARILGFRRVKCDTKLATVMQKARDFGFRELGQSTLFCKEI